jgi:hypothetical protein
MTQRDNYTDLSGSQAIFQPAINPDVPTQTGPILLKWRGVWAPGTLYNKNDLAKVPNVGLGGASTLEIALETHVASAIFDDDADLWGRVLDASELQSSGIPPDEIQAFVNAAAASAGQASGAATTAAGHAARAQSIADGMTTNIQTALDDIDAGVGQADAIRDDVSALGASVQTAADQAARYATAEPGIIVDPDTGAESAFSSMQKANNLLVTTALTPYFYIDNPASGSGQFDATPDASWLNRKVVVRSSRDCRIVLPVNLNRAPWSDGSDAAVFFRLKPVGTGVVSVVAGGSAVVNPDFIVDDHFSARQTAVAGTTTVLRSLTVPPGTGRYVIFESLDLFEVADTGRAHTVTAAVRGGATITMTKLQGPLTTNQYNSSGQQTAGTLWIGAIPDSVSASQIIDVTCVYPAQVFLYDQYIFVGGPAAGYNATTVGFSDAAATAAFADINLTVAAGKANSLAVLGFGGRQSGAVSGISSGVVRSSGLSAPPADATGGRNSTTLFGYQKNMAVGAQSWRTTWATTARHAGLGVLLEPGAGASSIALRTSLTLTGLTRYQEILIEALNDGVTYDIS